MNFERIELESRSLFLLNNLEVFFVKFITSFLWTLILVFIKRIALFLYECLRRYYKHYKVVFINFIPWFFIEMISSPL